MEKKGAPAPSPGNDVFAWRPRMPGSRGGEHRCRAGARPERRALLKPLHPKGGDLRHIREVIHRGWGDPWCPEKSFYASTTI